MNELVTQKIILNPVDSFSINRLGGNIPAYFDNKQDDINGMIFYGCFQHPLKNNLALSIFLPKDHDEMLENNIYPNCTIKIISHPESEESEITSFTNNDLNKIYFEPYKESYDDLPGLVKIGGSLELIQEEPYFYEALEQNGYSYLMKIDEDYYPDELLNGSYPFNYGALYLYYKILENENIDVIAGFWQHS